MLELVSGVQNNTYTSFHGSVKKTLRYDNIRGLPFFFFRTTACMFLEILFQKYKMLLKFGIDVGGAVCYLITTTQYIGGVGSFYFHLLTNGSVQTVVRRLTRDTSTRWHWRVVSVFPYKIMSISRQREVALEYC